MKKSSKSSDVSSQKKQESKLLEDNLVKLNKMEVSLTDFLFGKVDKRLEEQIDSITQKKKARDDKSLLKKESVSDSDDEDVMRDDDEEEGDSEQRQQQSDSESDDNALEDLKDEDLFMVDKTNNVDYDQMMEEISSKQQQIVDRDRMQEEVEQLQEKILISLQPAWTDDFSSQVYIQVDTTAEDEDEDFDDIKEARNTARKEQNKLLIQSYLSKKDYEKAEVLPDGQSLVTGSQYEEQMRKLYLKMHQTPAWAQLPIEKVVVENSEDKMVIQERFTFAGRAPSNEESKLDAISTDRVFNSTRQISKGQLDVNICADVNEQEKPGTILNAQFHPHSDLMAILSSDRVVRVFQVGKDKSVLVDRFTAGHDDYDNSRQRMRKNTDKYYSKGGAEINGIHFTADGTELLMTAPNTRRLFVTDMVTGKTTTVAHLIGKQQVGGKRTQVSDALLPIIQVSSNNELIAIASANHTVELLNRKTKFSIAKLAMNDPVRSLAFSKDALTLYTATKSGKVFLWDIRQQRPRHVFQDEGSIDTTVISVGDFTGRGRIVCGSSHGVVNIYDLDAVQSQESPKPLKTLMNLTTSVSHAQFNPDGRLLAVASKEKAGSLRMIHVESLSVYPDFPFKGTSASVHQYTVADVCFNSNSQYFAMASANRARLFEFPYYRSI